MRLFSAIVILAASSAPVLSAQVAPHRAIYDLELDKSGANTSLSSVDGRLAFEVSEAGCEGWTVNFRMANRYVPAEGDIRLVDTQSTSYETADGTELDYSEKGYVNQKLDSENRIKVTRSAVSETGAGHIIEPEQKDFEVAAGALFPMAHQLHIMDLAAAGTKQDSSMIYDGSDKENAYKVVSFIGKSKAPGENADDAANPQAAPLKTLRSWPVSISYFKTNSSESDTPDYQISFSLYENGVATGLHMDYGSFQMRGKLRNLEMLPAETCN